MATMAAELDAPGDVTGLLDGIAAQVAPPIDHVEMTLAFLLEAKRHADQITGYDMRWVLDIRCALDDTIEGVRGGILRL